MPWLQTLSILFFSFILSLGLTTLTHKILLKRAVLDIPNARSSHSVPTPRGGGWGILGVLIPGLFFVTLRLNKLEEVTPLLLALLILALVSWLDDRKGLSAKIRLGTHLFAGFIGSLSFTSDQTLFGHLLPYWLDRTIMIVGWAWFINLYNFMDGIDGITSIETISISTSACIVMSALGLTLPFIDKTTLLLTGTCLGFLVFNWHPARLFLGDIGSVPLGFLVGFCLLTLGVHGALIPAIILPLYYLADSGITLLRRVKRGEKVWEAHRSHFYQYASRGLGRHDLVIHGVILGNIGLLGSALIAVEKPYFGVFLATVTVALLLLWMHKVGRN